jgi:hypothetical protein
MPRLMDLGMGFVDMDGDGELSHVLGGPDCDDGNPEVGGARPEIPGNGIDDNCHAGDREPRAEQPDPLKAVENPPHVVLVTRRLGPSP